MDKDITLAKAISMATQSWEIKQHQTDIKGYANRAVDAVMANKHKQLYKAKPCVQARPAQIICLTSGKWSTQ